MSSFLFFPTAPLDPAAAGRQAYAATLAGRNPLIVAGNVGQPAAQVARTFAQRRQEAFNRRREEDVANEFGIFGSRDNARTRFGEGYEIVLGAAIFLLALLPFMTGHTEGTTFEWGLVMTIMYSTIGLFLYVYFRRVPKPGRVTILDQYSNIDINSPVKIFQAILYYYFFAPAKFAANVFYILEMIVRKLFGYKDPGEQTTSLKTFDFYQNTLASIKMRIQPYIDSSELLRILFVGPAYAKRRTLFSEDPIERTYNGPVNREVLLSTIILAVCVTVPAVITAARGEEMSRSYVKYSYGTIAVVSLIIFLLVYGTLQGYSSEILNKISGNMLGKLPEVRDFSDAVERREEINIRKRELEESLRELRQEGITQDNSRQEAVLEGQIRNLQRDLDRLQVGGGGPIPANQAQVETLLGKREVIRNFELAT